MKFYTRGARAAVQTLGLHKHAQNADGSQTAGANPKVGGIVPPPAAQQNPALKTQANTMAPSKPMVARAPTLPTTVPTPSTLPAKNPSAPPPAPPAMQPAVGTVWPGMAGSGGMKRAALLDRPNEWLRGLSKMLENRETQGAMERLRAAMKNATPGPYPNTVQIAGAAGEAPQIVRPGVAGMPKMAAFDKKKKAREKNKIMMQGMMLAFAPNLAASGLAAGGIALDKHLAGKNPLEAALTDPRHAIDTLGPKLGINPENIAHHLPSTKETIMSMGIPYSATKGRWTPAGLMGLGDAASDIIKSPAKGSPGALAHEVGHLSGKQIPGSVHFGNIYGMFAPLAAPQAEMWMDPDSTAAKALPYAAPLPMIPRLIEEGRASIKGYNALRQLGYGRKALLGLIPAGATYLTGALAPGISAEYVRRKKLEKGLG